MDIPENQQEFLDQVKYPRQSEENRRISNLLLEESHRLCDVAQSMLERLPELREEGERNTVRREYASGCRYLHRGFYCPSPAIERIIGNVRRGKILKRITRASKPTHEYGFDQDGRLLWCKTIDRDATQSVEYLVYEKNCICGITVDREGRPLNVTEEIFENGRVVRYTNVQFPGLGQCAPTDLDREEYGYEGEGVCQCCWQRLCIPITDIPDCLKWMKSMVPEEPFCLVDHFVWK